MAILTMNRFKGKGKRLNTIPSTGSNKVPLPLEEDIQMAIIDWARLRSYKGKKVFDYLHHTPNGGSRHLLEAKKFKAMGVKKGYPDLSFDIVTKKYAGLRIELKRGKAGKMSKEQSELLDLLNAEGYYAVECASIEAAIDTIERYITNKL